MGDIDDDDDFGDLYADVETLVNSGINDSGRRDIADNNHTAIENIDIAEVKSPGIELNGVEKLVLEDESDSEDDLNIVLNDDDFSTIRFPFVPMNGGFMGGRNANGKEKDADFTCANKGISSCKSYNDGFVQQLMNDGEGRGVCWEGNIPSSQSFLLKHITRSSSTFQETANGIRSSGARSDWMDNNEWNEDKFPGSSYAARRHVTGGKTHFNFPLKRTILYADIDKFEQKPWRNYGADVTDFFNYGFNEKSWKEYCCSMQHQQQTFMQTGIPACYNLNYYQECEGMAEDGTIEDTALIEQRRTDNHPTSKFTVAGSELPKGRAIQVKDSIGERQSSMDVKQPLRLDTNVVIQITGQEDTRENHSGSDKEMKEKDIDLHEASENGDDDADVHIRCSQQGVSINSKPKDSFAKELQNRNTEVKDPCFMETDFSNGDKVQLSPDPSLSSFESLFETSEDDAYIEHEETQESSRRSSLNPFDEPRKSHKSIHHSSRDFDNNNTRGKSDYSKKSARRIKSPVQERQALYNKRPYDYGSYHKENVPISREKVHPRFRNESNSYVQRNYSTREYFHEQIITNKRNWYHQERGNSTKNDDYFMYKDKKWVSNYSSYTHERKDPHWRRQNDEHSFESRHESRDYWLKSGHADNYIDWEMLDKDYNYPDDQRRGIYDNRNPSDMDYPRFRGMKYNNRQNVDYYNDDHHLPSQCYRESYARDYKKWPDVWSHRDDINDERFEDDGWFGSYNDADYDRYGRSRYDERDEDDGWFGSYDDADYPNYGATSSNNQAREERNGYHKKYKSFHSAKNELLTRHEGVKFNQKVSRNEKNLAPLDRPFMAEKKRQHTYEMIKERNAGRSGSHPTLRVDHDPRVSTCRNSAHLEETSKRCTKAGNTSRSDKLENLHSKKDVDNHTTSMELTKIPLGKLKIESGHGNEEQWLDKFPISEQNEALDLEEGQIRTDYPDKLKDENGAIGNELFKGIQQDRIIESLKKMEKRRERFKERITTRKESGQIHEPQIESVDTNQRRPVRKRRWGKS